MSMHLHCPYCGEVLAEDQSVVTMSTREGTRQETYHLACRCGTRIRLELPPERWSPARRRRSRRNRAHARHAARRSPTPTLTSAEGPAALPSADRPFPFTPWQYARLLLLRGRVRDGEVAEDPEPAGGDAASS